MEFNNVMLRSFCAGNELRPVTCRPWSVGDHSYATDGAIAVRVARSEDVPPPEKDITKTATMLDGWLAATADVDRVSLPHVEIVPGKRWICEKCDGRGYAHDCPECTCECDDCDGGYRYQHVIVMWRGMQVKARIWQLIAALPNSKIATRLSPAGHIAFSFDGGSGICMPMRVPLDDDEPLRIPAEPPITVKG